VNYSDLSPPELFSICSNRRDPSAWEEFIRRFNPVIARGVIRVAIRHGTSDKSLIDDLVQETYLKICANDCKLLRSFVPKQLGSAFAYLKVVATSVAQDHFKCRLAEKRAPESSAESTDGDSVPFLQERRDAELNPAERLVLIDQIDRKLKAVVPAQELSRARTVFWLYYRFGFTASAIATMSDLNLTTKGVESLLFRLTRLVREGFSDFHKGSLEQKKGIQQFESF
jgi:RNA polymerase sigma-70 factor (ECF subfamily)